MRDIPMFTTQNGVASLTLREIPYQAAAYVRIQSASDAGALIAECRDFCKAAGAERVFATGHASLETYPFYTAILQMRRAFQGLPETDAALFPVTEKTLSFWRDIYNKKMASVPNASYMTLTDADQRLVRGDGYFVHRGDTLLGIGTAAGETIGAVASTVPGAGRDVTLALCRALSGEQIILEVASVNTRAVRLYENLGFVKTAEFARWYQIF